MWHGNYDPSSVTRAKPKEQAFHVGETVGVHAGTRRSAMDRLDTLGEYDPDEAGDQAQDVEARGGYHGYLHPVLPQSGRVAKGLQPDEGHNWKVSMLGVNPRLRAKAESGDLEPDHFERGLRYENSIEHPGSASVLLPNASNMQHSDYVREALQNSQKVHPLTERLFNEGILDQAEARRYTPRAPRNSDTNYEWAESEPLRQERTARVRESRRRAFHVAGQRPLPFGRPS